MFQKDTYRLIRKTFNRFFTLVCIVLIGVAFMMGLLATPPIQRESVDRYFKEQHLQDIQFYSTYGFCAEDVEAIKGMEIVEDIFPSKMTDAYLRYADGTTSVSRFREMDSDVNQFKLIAGRLPENDKEALILENEKRIGQTIKVYLDKEDAIFDYLKYDEYTIVGAVESSEYLAKMKSTSNLNNLDLETVIYLDNDVFVFDYYTTIYVTLTDCADVNAFSNAYSRIIDDAEQEINVLAKRQEGYLKETILEEYEDKIREGEETLALEKEKGQKQLDDAKQELDDANIKLIASKMQIDTMVSTINSTKESIAKEEQYINTTRPKIDAEIKAIEDADAKKRSFDEIYSDVSVAYGTYTALKSQLAANEAELAVLNETLAGLEDNAENAEERARIQNEINTLEQSNAVIREGIASIENSYPEGIETTYAKMTGIVQEKATLEVEAKTLEVAKDTLANTEKQLETASIELEKGEAQYNSGLRQYKNGVIEFNEKIEEAEDELRKAKQDLEELPSAGWIILDHDSHYSTYMYENTCNQMEAICIVMPVLFFLVAALVCMTTMTRLVDEQRGQIGIFRALGFTNRQIIGKYLQYALIASMIGSFFGVIIGVLIFPTVIYETWRLMYFLPPMIRTIHLGRLLICLLSFAILMETVTFFVVKKILVEQPAQLMRPKAPKAARKVFLEYIPVLWDKLNFTTKITLRNLIRYKSRFFMTVIGVAGCTALLVLGFGIKDSISDVVNLQFSEIFDYQYNVNLDNDNTIDEVVKTLEEDLNNDEIVPYMSYYSKVYANDKEETIICQVMDARSASKIMNLEEKGSDDLIKLSNRGVLISEKFAKNNNIKAGDIITIESKGQVKAEVRVEAIVKMYFQHYLFVSEELYASLFEDTIHYTNIALRSSNDIALIEDSLKDNEDVASVSDFNSMIEQFNTMIEALDFIIAVIILTSGALALVVLINLTQVNISERIREIATLKVLGFRNNEVDAYIFKEIMLLTVIGGIVGLPLGKICLRFVLNVINMDMIMFPVNIKYPSYLISFAITFVFTILVLLMTKKPLKNIKMVESLKSVE